MRKIISFCVWGDKPIYNFGLYENAILLPKIFPNWIMQIYYTKTCNQDVIKELNKIKNVECILQDYEDHYRNSMLRFLAGFEPKNDVVIFRDSDSLLLERDYLACEEWVNSDKDIHIVRDHPKHDAPLLAGLWGVKNGFLVKNNIKEKYDLFFNDLKNKKWGIDQEFLEKYIHPLINNKNSMIHIETLKKEKWAIKFPKGAKRTDDFFVGFVNKNIKNSAEKFNYNKEFVTKTRTENKL